MLTPDKFEQRFQVRPSEDSVRVFRNAEGHAQRLGHTYIGTGHLMLGLLGDQKTQSFLEGIGIQQPRYRKLLEVMIPTGPSHKLEPLELTQRAVTSLQYASDMVRNKGLEVTPMHILAGLAAEGENMGVLIMEPFGVGLVDLRSAIVNHYKASKTTE